VLVHDWLTGMRGGEKVLEVMAERWPDARLYTLLHKKGSVSPTIERLAIRTSFLDHFPRAHALYRYFLPLMPFAARSWRLPAADGVLSFSHCVAKSVKVPPGVPHVCYCFTPMRYAWQMRQAYLGGRLGGWPARIVERLLDQLREWDRATSDSVDYFIAISRTIQRRIRDCYRRESVIIHPPVDTDFYTPASVRREEFYLVVSALAPYKRLDLALAACARLGRPLIVIGTGQDERRLRSQASAEVRFLGWQSDEVIRDHLRRCRALLFPGEEDFGIVPVEAMACGAAVIAYGAGGATETVVPLDDEQGREPTGVWFAQQTVDSLVEAMLLFEARAEVFDARVARRQALRFTTARYADELFGHLRQILPSPPVATP
jgi:glycosyltransferase involved in cell wall biosynthesis